MKKLIAGFIALMALGSCARDEDETIENQHENTKINKAFLKEQGEEALKRESDTIRAVSGPSSIFEPTDGLDPGTSTDPGEVGPVVTTPPK